MTLALMTSVCALWLVVAIHALADVSAHFNPAISLGFAMRGDMSWARATCLRHCSMHCRDQCRLACARIFRHRERSVDLPPAIW